MKNLILSSLALMLITFSSCSKKEENPEAKEPSKGETSLVQNLQLAGDIARYGYANNSALSLIQAAEIVNTIDTRELKSKKTEEGEKKADEGAKKGKISLDVNELIADATTLANGDVALLSVIEGMKKEIATPSRGRQNGPAETYSIVYAFSTDKYSIVFNRGQLAEIALISDGDCDIDMYVYDQNGNLIQRDNSYSAHTYVSWVPSWTGSYTVKVVNRGGVYAKYYLVTN